MKLYCTNQTAIMLPPIQYFMI